MEIKKQNKQDFCENSCVFACFYCTVSSFTELDPHKSVYSHCLHCWCRTNAPRIHNAESFDLI